MPDTQGLTDTELAEIRRRRPGVRASLACEGIHLTAGQRIKRLIELSLAEHDLRPVAAE